MKRVRAPLLSGQGTLEYILLTTVVVGIVLTIFNGPLKSFLGKYKSRQTEYTDVVSQRKLGIPMRWFGGRFPDPGGGGAGGATTDGGVTPIDDSDTPTPSGDPAIPTNAQNAGGDPSKDGDGGDGDSPGSSGPGRGGNPANNSLLSPGSAGNASNTRGSRGNRSGADGAAGEGDGDTAGGGGGAGGTQNRTEGSIGADGAPLNETEAEKEERIKRAESGESLKEAKALYGSSAKKRVRDGSCGDLDLKVILQIAFVIGLFFLLASMLFQKRDR